MSLRQSRLTCKTDVVPAEPRTISNSCLGHGRAPRDAILTRGPQDRAAIATTAIIQTIVTALRARLDDRNASLAAVRPEIEAILREEFFETARQARDEITSPTRRGDKRAGAFRQCTERNCKWQEKTTFFPQNF